MNETKVLYIGYAPGNRCYTAGGLKQTSIENYCRLIDIFRSSEFNLQGLPSQEKVKGDWGGESISKMIRQASKPFRQRFSPYWSLSDADKAKFRNISDLEKFIKCPQNKEKEPEKFKFCTDYLAFKKWKWERCNRRAWEDMKNFTYMLVSIRSCEMQAKVYKGEEIVKQAKTHKKAKKVKKGKGKRIKKVKRGTAGLHSSEVSENNRDGKCNASFDESSLVTEPVIGEECEDSFSTVETNFKPEEHSVIECFPDNVLMNIFSKVDLASINAVKATCRRFNTVAQDHEVWRGVFAEEFDVDPNVLKSQPDNGTWEEICKSLWVQQEFKKRKNKGNGSCEDVMEDIYEDIHEETVKDIDSDTFEETVEYVVEDTCDLNVKDTVKVTVEDTVEDKPEMESHCFVFYMPNVMYRPNPRAYTALSQFLATIRNNTLGNHLECKLERNNEDDTYAFGRLYPRHLNTYLCKYLFLEQRAHFLCNGF